MQRSVHGAWSPFHPSSLAEPRGWMRYGEGPRELAALGVGEGYAPKRVPGLGHGLPAVFRSRSPSGRDVRASEQPFPSRGAPARRPITAVPERVGPARTLDVLHPSPVGRARPPHEAVPDLVAPSPTPCGPSLRPGRRLPTSIHLSPRPGSPPPDPDPGLASTGAPAPRPGSDPDGPRRPLPDPDQDGSRLRRPKMQRSRKVLPFSPCARLPQTYGASPDAPGSPGRGHCNNPTGWRFPP